MNSGESVVKKGCVVSGARKQRIWWSTDENDSMACRREGMELESVQWRCDSCCKNYQFFTLKVRIHEA